MYLPLYRRFFWEFLDPWLSFDPIWAKVGFSALRWQCSVNGEQISSGFSSQIPILSLYRPLEWNIQISNLQKFFCTAVLFHLKIVIQSFLKRNPWVLSCQGKVRPTKILCTQKCGVVRLYIVNAYAYRNKCTLIIWCDSMAFGAGLHKKITLLRPMPRPHMPTDPFSIGNRTFIVGYLTSRLISLWLLHGSRVLPFSWYLHNLWEQTCPKHLQRAVSIDCFLNFLSSIISTFTLYLKKTILYLARLKRLRLRGGGPLPMAKKVVRLQQLLATATPTTATSSILRPI